MPEQNNPSRYGQARDRGFVLVTMAFTTAGVLAAAGLGLDLGRIFIAKDEMQVYCDGAAAAAALALNGTSSGFQAAQNAVTNSTNKWNFGTAAVNSSSVAFATSSSGPWAANPASASGYTYVQVTASAPVKLYFLPLVTRQANFTLSATAVAGQVDINSLSRGLSPYTAVSTNNAGPTFGLVVGSSYDIHWPTYNGSRHGCGPADPLKCFNSAPCAGDSNASLVAVVSNWGSQYHGYWGSTSNSQIANAVIDSIQLAPLAVGN